jgi:hypothetical protein
MADGEDRSSVWVDAAADFECAVHIGLDQCQHQRERKRERKLKHSTAAAAAAATRAEQISTELFENNGLKNNQISVRHLFQKLFSRVENLRELRVLGTAQ